MSPAVRISLQFTALVLIWSTSFLWIKILVVEIPPAWLAVWRLVLGASVLSMAAWMLSRSHARKSFPDLHLTSQLNPTSSLKPSSGLVQSSGSKPSPNLKPALQLPWRMILIVALLGNALPYTLIHAGEVSVDSGIAAILIGTMPLATFGFAWLILGERLSKMQFAGLALGFVGLMLLVGVDAISGLGQAWGQLLVVAGSICYALSATLVRLLGSSRSVVVAAVTLWVAVLFVLPFAFWNSPVPVLPQSVSTWTALFILGVFCTGGAAFLYFQLLGQVSANKFAQINYIIPLLGYLWGLLFMQETLRWQAVLAALLIVLGVRAVLKGQVATQ